MHTPNALSWGVLQGGEEEPRPYVTLAGDASEEWKDGSFYALPSPAARRQLGDNPQSKELKELLRAWEETAEPKGLSWSWCEL